MWQCVRWGSSVKFCFLIFCTFEWKTHIHVQGLREVDLQRLCQGSIVFASRRITIWEIFQILEESIERPILERWIQEMQQYRLQNMQKVRSRQESYEREQTEHILVTDSRNNSVECVLRWVLSENNPRKKREKKVKRKRKRRESEKVKRKRREEKRKWESEEEENEKRREEIRRERDHARSTTLAVKRFSARITAFVLLVDQREIRVSLLPIAQTRKTLSGFFELGFFQSLGFHF
jgi:hypothetical protein